MTDTPRRDLDLPAAADDESAQPFHLAMPAHLPMPVLLSIPHAGRNYTPSILSAMRDPTVGATRLEDRHADTLGRAVAAETGAAILIAQAPRAVIDLNRAPDDVDWSMIRAAAPRRTNHSLANRRARSGLGLVPRRLPGTGEIWRGPLDSGELAGRIADIHQPYHRAIGTALDAIRDRWGAALLIDLHSMPPLPPTNGGQAGAEFVIGDRFGAACAPRLAAALLHHLGAAGRIVAHNRPYSGGYTLDRHASPRRGIHAIQIEVCRSCYLDGDLNLPSARLPAAARIVASGIRAVVDELTRLVDGAGGLRAAE